MLILGSLHRSLSYTIFVYSNLEVTVYTDHKHDTIRVTCNVRNIGSSEGSDVAQLYMHQQRSTGYQAIESLRAVEGFKLKPGASKHIGLLLPLRQLAL